MPRGIFVYGGIPPMPTSYHGGVCGVGLCLLVRAREAMLRLVSAGVSEQDGQAENVVVTSRTVENEEISFHNRAIVA
jgi:hypothetical protein